MIFFCNPRNRQIQLDGNEHFEDKEMKRGLRRQVEMEKDSFSRSKQLLASQECSIYNTRGAKYEFLLIVKIFPSDVLLP